MQNKVKFILAIILLVGGIITLISLIARRINIFIGLPILILTLGSIIIYIRTEMRNKAGTLSDEEQLITGSLLENYLDTGGRVFSQYQQEDEQLPDGTKMVALARYESTPADSGHISRENITVSVGNEFYQFLIDIIDSHEYFVSTRVLLSDILVFNLKQNQGLLDNAKVDYLICKKANYIPVLIINIYSEKEEKQYKLLLSRLLSKAKIPLMVLSKNQQYKAADLVGTVALYL